ncbi:MAG: hypothetical protein ACRDRG_19480 [Pseudonocardiaceae bacterium]
MTSIPDAVVVPAAHQPGCASHHPAAQACLSVDDAAGDDGSIVGEQEDGHPGNSSGVFQRPQGNARPTSAKISSVAQPVSVEPGLTQWWAIW